MQKEPLTSLEPLYNLALKRLDIQSNQIDVLQAKAGIALSIASLILGIPAAMLSQRIVLTLPLIGVGLASVVTYLLIVILSIKAFMGAGIKMPSPKGFYDLYFEKPPDETKGVILLQSVNLIVENNQLIGAKNKCASLALFFLPLEALLIVAYVALCFWN